jgi:hypothetical protein
MIYKLIGVEKVTKPEKFDRSSIIGDKFEFVCSPVTGKRLCAYDLNGRQYLTTTAIMSIIKASDYITVKTKHTAYTFQPVAEPVP